MYRYIVWTGSLFFIASCGSNPRLSDSYISHYKYLSEIREHKSSHRPLKEEELPDAFVIVAVDAPHLHYQTVVTLLKSMRRGIFFEREPLVGHVWLLISYKKESGKRVYYEVGHSGELGTKYMDEVLRRARSGEYDNPLQYLYEDLNDGYLERGSGGHYATLSALFEVSRERIDRWKQLTFGEDGYDFSRWSLVSHNCVTYVIVALRSLGIDMEITKTTIEVPQHCLSYKLWKDGTYGSLSVITVDDMEKWLWSQIVEGKAHYVPQKIFPTLRRICIDISEDDMLSVPIAKGGRT